MSGAAAPPAARPVGPPEPGRRRTPALGGAARSLVAALAIVAAATCLRAQTAPTGPARGWIGRFAVGAALQDPWAYLPSAGTLGATVGFRFGEGLTFRADVWHARFGTRLDPCAKGLFPSCPPRAPDREDQWAAGAALEWDPHQSGLYLVGGVAALRRTGTALRSPGVRVGPEVAVGLRLGSVVSLEARMIRLLGVSAGREAWSMPLLIVFGP